MSKFVDTIVRTNKLHCSDCGDKIHKGDDVIFEVTDSGAGISQEDIPRVFERFYMANKSRSKELGGTGLGLSIVKHIIEAHNQTINVRSAIGIGTTFGFTLKKGE